MEEIWPLGSVVHLRERDPGGPLGRLPAKPDLHRHEGGREADDLRRNWGRVSGEHLSWIILARGA